MHASLKEAERWADSHGRFGREFLPSSTSHFLNRISFLPFLPAQVRTPKDTHRVARALTRSLSHQPDIYS